MPVEVQQIVAVCFYGLNSEQKAQFSSVLCSGVHQEGGITEIFTLICFWIGTTSAAVVQRSTEKTGVEEAVEFVLVPIALMRTCKTVKMLLNLNLHFKSRKFKEKFNYF